jgi:hypothetical protein
MAEGSAAEAAAMEVLDRYLAAVNAVDEEAADATLHFPHIRISNEKVKIYQRPGESPLARFRRFAADDGWHHSEWNSRRVLHQSGSKVHLEVTFTRSREDNSVIGKYTSIYVVTKVDGRWGIQARSTFAP